MRNRRTAFTLIELLVVIAIIAILIDYCCLPCKGARRQWIKCANNLKQITSPHEPRE